MTQNAKVEAFTDVEGTLWINSKPAILYGSPIQGSSYQANLVPFTIDGTASSSPAAVYFRRR